MYHDTPDHIHVCIRACTYAHSYIMWLFARGTCAYASVDGNRAQGRGCGHRSARTGADDGTPGGKASRVSVVLADFSKLDEPDIRSRPARCVGLGGLRVHRGRACVAGPIGAGVPLRAPASPVHGSGTVGPPELIGVDARLPERGSSSWCAGRLGAPGEALGAN